LNVDKFKINHIALFPSMLFKKHWKQYNIWKQPHHTIRTMNRIILLIFKVMATLQLIAKCTLS